jgi:plasmid stabilization system protein ParE
MASRKRAVKLTANFEANLAAIEAFWIEANAPQAYRALLDDLLETVVPSLLHYPRMGRSFLGRQTCSIESRAAAKRLRARIGRGEIGEYLAGDYLVLYALIGNDFHLLSIKHHRQLSFDFASLWSK